VLGFEKFYSKIIKFTIEGPSYMCVCARACVRGTEKKLDFSKEKGKHSVKRGKIKSREFFNLKVLRF